MIGNGTKHDSPPKKVATTKKILHPGLMKAVFGLLPVFLSRDAVMKVPDFLLQYISHF